MIVVLMGVAGCGKTTVGERLAAACGWKFFDADNFHPRANVAKMTAGEALDDRDREPWLASLNRELSSCARKGESAVLACSALKQSYRDRLSRGIQNFHLVYLRGSFAAIEQRLLARPNHFMKAGLLESQFQTLEEPASALVVDVAESPERIVNRIRKAFSAP